MRHGRGSGDAMGPSMPEDEEEALMRELLHLLESQPEKVEQAVLRDPQLHKYLTHQLKFYESHPEKEVPRADPKQSSQQYQQSTLLLHFFCTK